MMKAKHELVSLKMRGWAERYLQGEIMGIGGVSKVLKKISEKLR